MEEITSTNVQFRYVGIKSDDYEVPGICLCYPDKQSATDAYSILHDYMTTGSGGKSFRVIFIKSEYEKYTLKIKVETPEKVLNVNISDIDPLNIKKLPAGLKLVAYYIIFAGYMENGQFHLLPPNKYHLFKNDIVIDGEVITGKPMYKVDWNKILE